MQAIPSRAGHMYRPVIPKSALDTDRNTREPASDTGCLHNPVKPFMISALSSAATAGDHAIEGNQVTSETALDINSLQDFEGV